MKPLYTNDKTAQIDQLAAEWLAVDSFELMLLAGQAVFQHVKAHDKLLVVTGPGNNGGDGFVVAELARRNKQQVTVLAMRSIDQLQGDARKAAEQYQGSSINFSEVNFSEFTAEIDNHNDCILDAVFGTGLTQSVADSYGSVIQWINQQDTHVVAIDVPSGLNGSTGKIEGCSVNADVTVAILARNAGLYTMDGKSTSGQVMFESLGVDPKAYDSIPHTAHLSNYEQLSDLQSKRAMNSHKGQFGHVLAIGGQVGMLGAVLLGAQAVMKSGAGMCTVVTDESHANWIPLNAPELMTYAYDMVDGSHLLLQQHMSQNSNVVLIGMGLGQSQWSKRLLKDSIKLNKLLVMDADALSLLATLPQVPSLLSVITPHPKEAATLLNMTVEQIQADRWQAVKLLADKYQCVVVLKGSGSLISDGDETWCCPYGNANLATAGTGDVLAGLVAGLLAQGHAPLEAANHAVTWHAVVGEMHQAGFTMTASDLIDSLHTILA